MSNPIPVYKDQTLPPPLTLKGWRTGTLSGFQSNIHAKYILSFISVRSFISSIRVNDKINKCMTLRSCEAKNA